MSELLQVSNTNIKLDENAVKIYSVSLPAGRTCPFAKDCKAWVTTPPEGKPFIERGEDTEFDCFAARMELRFPKLRAAWAKNLRLIEAEHARNGTDGVTQLMYESINNALTKAERAGESAWYFRPHVGGGMFKQWYFESYLNLAENNPAWRIYFYSKAIKFLVTFKQRIANAHNFIPNASLGGTHDHLIAESGIRSARVVWSEQEALDLGLEIDRDDSLASNPEGGDFAILLHGNQKPGSAAAEALREIKRHKKLKILQGAA